MKAWAERGTTARNVRYPYDRSLSATFYIFLAAATGAWIVTADLGAFVAHGGGGDDLAVGVIQPAVVAAEAGEFVVRDGRAFLTKRGNEFPRAFLVACAAGRGADDLQFDPFGIFRPMPGGGGVVVTTKVRVQAFLQVFNLLFHERTVARAHHGLGGGRGLGSADDWAAAVSVFFSGFAGTQAHVIPGESNMGSNIS